MSASPWGSWTSPGGRRRSPKTWPRFTRDGGDPLFPCAVPQGDPGIDERDLVESACFRGLPSREVLHPPGIAGIPTGKPAWTGDEPVIPMGKRRFPPGNANSTPENAAIPRSVSISLQGWAGKEENWWSRRESNPRPLECHSSALPTELRPHRDADCTEGWAGVSNPYFESGECRNHARVDDPAVLRQQGGSQDPGGGDNQPVRWVSMELWGKRDNFSRDRRRDGQAPDERRSGGPFQPIPNREPQFDATQIDQVGDLPQGNVSHPERFFSFSRLPEDLSLRRRKARASIKPPDQDVGVEKRSQSAFPSASHTSAEKTGSRMSPRTLTVPCSESCGYFPSEAAGGRRRATGRPRFMMVMGSPVSLTSSRIAKHLALNSDARIDRI